MTPRTKRSKKVDRKKKGRGAMRLANDHILRILTTLEPVLPVLILPHQALKYLDHQINPLVIDEKCSPQYTDIDVKRLAASLRNPHPHPVIRLPPHLVVLPVKKTVNLIYVGG